MTDNIQEENSLGHIHRFLLKEVSYGDGQY